MENFSFAKRIHNANSPLSGLVPGLHAETGDWI